MAISYSPSNDKLILKLRPLKEKQTKEFGSFKLWWDEEGNINGIVIVPFTEESEEFKKNLHTVRLDGIWKGKKITDWKEFIESTYGSMADDQIYRGEQGQYEIREVIG